MCGLCEGAACAGELGIWKRQERHFGIDKSESGHYLLSKQGKGWDG